VLCGLFLPQSTQRAQRETNLKTYNLLFRSSVDSEPAKIVNALTEFFSQAIKTQMTGLEETYQDQHTGRLQTDDFLQTANLSGKIFYKPISISCIFIKI